MIAARSRLSVWLYATAGLSTVAHLVGLYLLSRGSRSLELVCWTLAGLLWLLTLAILRRAPALQGIGARRRAVGLMIGLALLLRLPALVLPVTHTDDIHRYLWDGAAQAAGQNPYAGSPESPAFSELRHQHPEVYAHINHRYLPTIYPPVAQSLFRLHAALGKDPATFAAVRDWKILVGVIELLACAVLIVIAIKKHHDVRIAMVWTSSPLVAIEVYLNGHIEPLGVLLALLAWLCLRRPAILAAGLGGGFLSAAILVKPVAVAIVPGLFSELRTRVQKGRVAAICIGALLCASIAILPYRSAGTGMAGSLGEYGRRWRSNDGAYAIVHAITERGVAILYSPPYYEPWRPAWLARKITGRDRDTVWPDELSNAIARTVGASLLGALFLFALRRRLNMEEAGLLLLSGYALLTPTLHPWYLLWPLALLPIAASSPLTRVAGSAVLWLSALAPLSYFVEGGAVWARLVEHGAAWLALALTLRHELRRPQAAALQSTDSHADRQGEPDATSSRAPR